MTARFREHATYEDLINVPENMVGELIEGELYTSPRPAGPHTLAVSSLAGILVPPFQFGLGGPGGWWILIEPELHLRRDVLVPDLAGWRKERMPEIPTGHVFSVVPDWVCEVISPSNNRVDRLKKMPIYAREGVPYAWIVNPVEQLLEAHKLHEGQWLVRAHGGDRLRVEPLDAIEMDMTLVWGPSPA